MKFRSCDCRRIELPLDGRRWRALVEAGEGAFAFGTLIEGDKTMTSIMISMPYDGSPAAVHNLAIYRDGEPKPRDPAWQWDGNREAPTLTPSIACGMPKGCDWHGYMTAGRLVARE